MGAKTQNGFTIIEVMLFLAITGMLAAAILVGSGVAIGQQRYRDSQGRYGLIDEFCPHRGVSLWFGRNEDCGLRCHYHGWSDAIHLATDPAEDGASTGGQDPDALRHVIVLDWGSLEALCALDPREVAAVIMEPAAINAGCFEPRSRFLRDRFAVVPDRHDLVG